MRTFILTAVLLAGLVFRASATVIVPADLSELIHDAQWIARGTVVRVDGQWAEGRRTIETVVTLETERYLKGDAGETLQFRVPGGVLGRFRNLVVGAPQFAVGQRVVVFLGANGPRVPHVLGLHQGVYRLGASADGRAVVLPPPSMPGVSGPVVRGAADRRPAPLTEFEGRVMAAVESGR